jgi:hypothetical protein
MHTRTEKHRENRLLPPRQQHQRGNRAPEQQEQNQRYRQGDPKSTARPEVNPAPSKPLGKRQIEQQKRRSQPNDKVAERDGCHKHNIVGCYSH